MITAPLVNGSHSSVSVDTSKASRTIVSHYVLDNQDKLKSAFSDAMVKLSLVGQNVTELVDCSEVIPQPVAAKGQAHIPAGLDLKDIEQACAETPFPSLSVAAGAATSIAAV